MNVECSVHFTAEQIELRVCNSNKEEKVFQSIVSRCYEEIQTMIRSHLNVRLEDMQMCAINFGHIIGEPSNICSNIFEAKNQLELF